MQFASFGVSLRALSGASCGASEEVFVFPLSPMSGKGCKLLGRHSLTFFSRDDGLNAVAR